VSPDLLSNPAMQLESLKVFCDLAETESFTRAAQINSVTQSAVSQTISSMEKQFKALLIERSKKNFRLTPEGEVVYQHSKSILQSYGALESKLQHIKGVISGSIRVATVYSIGLHELPPCLKRFLKEYPTVNVRVEYRHSDEVYEDVLTNIVDLGLVAYPTPDPKLEIIPLRKDSLVLVCHPQHPLAKMKTVKYRSLDQQKFVNFARDIPTRKALDKLFRQQGVAVENVLEFDNVETVKQAVEIDSGIAILPEDTIKQEVAKGTLASVPLELNMHRQLALLHKKGKVLSPAMKQFIELLKKEF
jgi:DNA-binding transcriptional LysR family regulator